ncbi:MAG: DNA helicase [Ktedonobacterales bacterium]|nr:MAG: DNA helicase [Ktedonobacterales bacterium]
MTGEPALETPTDDTTIILDLRGRDLILIPPASLWALDDAALYITLFGPDDAPAAPALLARDRRHRFLRARPIDFSRLRAALLATNSWRVEVAFPTAPLLPLQPTLQMSPRPYQEEALLAWRAAGYRGVVVLPTGGGKTLVGAQAIADLGLWALIVVPTIDLLGQWRDALAHALALASDEHLGVYGGGSHDVRPITIITYESAQLHPELLRQFGVLVFDECHHLPAPTYRQIAEGAYTPYRLGLSATPERADLEHLALTQLIGPEVYRRAPEELSAARYLAAYDEQQLTAQLSPDDLARYSAARATYRDFLSRRRIAITSPADFQRKILWASARDSAARTAMLAWREARSLALNAPAKLALLETLFARHQDERVLVFSEYNTLVEQVSRRFCIPQITYKTPADERRQILERFRAGQYTKLVTGRVLNEGVDIPDCGVAIIVSGTSTRREYIQRLGRVLRPKATRAILYELITENTTEERVAERRRGQKGQH